MAARKQLPTMIFIGPTQGGRSKIQHKRCLAEILKLDEYGNPKEFRLIRDDEHLSADRQNDGLFIPVYVPVQFLPATELSQ